jgi:epoxide hydrolase-like predicted phosphatase
MNHKFEVKKYKVLLFDLGGVILDLSFANTFGAFAKESKIETEQVERDFNSVSFFKEFETGKVAEPEFRMYINQLLQTNLSDTVIDNAWNAMLETLPVNRLKVLDSLKKSHTLILFSNTNSIHLRKFTNIVNSSSDKPFEKYFDAAYYSHLVGMRKPDLETYQWICKQHNLQAETILFFDDNLANLQGAQTVGINTYHVTNADELFKELERQI